MVEDLIECRARLIEQTKAMRTLREAHENQLMAVSRQLLDLECGLRKRERELCTALQQKDRVIKEQAHIIRFLGKKTGTKRRDILSLTDEAVAKIPQWETEGPRPDAPAQVMPQNPNSKLPEADLTANTTPNSVITATLSSILESESENDSAVILDDHSSPVSTVSTKGVSRSVSDVMSNISSSTPLQEKEESSSQAFDLLVQQVASKIQKKTSVDGTKTGLNNAIKDLPSSMSRSNSSSNEDDNERQQQRDLHSSPFASPNYRGFLLRHGSYERYKIRSRMQQKQQQQQEDAPLGGQNGDQDHHDAGGDFSDVEMSRGAFAQIAATATLPRRSKKKKVTDDDDKGGKDKGLSHHIYHVPAISTSLQRELGIERTSRSSNQLATTDRMEKLSSTKSNGNTTVIIVNSNSSSSAATPDSNASSSSSKQMSNNHRSVKTPRDVKNKSNRTKMKMIMKMAAPGHNHHITRPHFGSSLSLNSSDNGSSNYNCYPTSNSSSPSPCSKSPSPPTVGSSASPRAASTSTSIMMISNKYRVQQRGSVYCNLFSTDSGEESPHHSYA